MELTQTQKHCEGTGLGTKKNISKRFPSSGLSKEPGISLYIDINPIGERSPMKKKVLPS
jgi:hypothetical protein